MLRQEFIYFTKKLYCKYFFLNSGLLRVMQALGSVPEYCRLKLTHLYLRSIYLYLTSIELEFYD